MSSNYDPKIIIDTVEHGNPFDTIDDSLNWLLKEARKKGYDAQVRALFEVEGTTRYAVSQVTQHTDLNTVFFNLKLSSGKKFANASTSLTSKSGLELLLTTAINSLHNSPEIPFYQGLPEPRTGELVDMSGVEWSIEDRIDAIIEAVNAAEEISNSKELILAGAAIESKVYKRIISSEGIDVEDSQQNNYFKVNAICGKSNQRGYGQEELHWRYDYPDYELMSKTATKTALDTMNLVTIDAPKDYEVLLGTQAVADLLIYILFSADATSFHESNSFLTDNLGKQLFDEKITIENLPRDPKQATIVSSFDYEGLPTENHIFLDKGVFRFIPYTSLYAAKYLGDKNAASGLSLPIPWGLASFPVSAVITSGDRSLEDQLAEMENGLYVKNFWYNRFTIRRKGGLTGLTRNGLYHVKNGEIQGAVRNLRYTESFLKAFAPGNVISVSNERRKYEVGNVPSIHLQKYHFSSIAHTNE